MSPQNIWRGQALLFDAHSTGTTTVTVSISPDGICIENRTPLLSYTFSQLKMTAARGGYVRIEIKNSGGSVLSIQSEDAVHTLEANHQLRRGFLGRLSHNNQLVVATTTFVIAVVLFLTVGLDLLASVTARLIPFELEKKLGDSVVEGMIAGKTVSTDSTTIRVLEKCASVVQEFDASGGKAQYRITLVEDSSIRNAFALPGGQIIVYRGILDLMHNESELFGLLGHEVGHVVERHGVKRIARSAALGLITSLLLGDANGISAILISNGQQLVNLSYDRDEELEADMFGLRAVQRAGIDARGIVTLFTSLKDAEGSEGWLAFLSTHPDIDERLKILNAEIVKVISSSYRSRLMPEEWNRLTKTNEAGKH